MSTWHQRRNPVPLWHPTKWTVVEDPPNGTMTVSRFDTEQQAREHANKVRGYVLTPSEK